MNKRLQVLLIALAGLIACYSGNLAAGPAESMAPKPQFDSEQLALGEKLFQANCAICHGANAQGAKNWTRRGSDGKYPPPPLNGSGHAWHHSREVLIGTILAGSPEGEGNMPSWKGRLSKQEIEAVITWLQSKWPPPIYEAWREMQQQGH